MIIMIVFLVLSVLFVIGTAIYMRRVNNRQTRLIEKASNIKETKEKSSKKKTKKTLSDILKIKIKGKMICLGNRFSIIVSLGSIDYNMLSFQEQEAVEDILIQTALSIDYPIQFFSTTEYVDTSEVIKKIKANKFNNENVKEYQQLLINHLEDLMGNNKISIIKNYAIISYDGTYRNARNELDRKYILLKNGLIRARINCNCLTENELYNLIYRELNKNSRLKVDNLIKGGDALYVQKKRKKKRKN